MNSKINCIVSTYLDLDLEFEHEVLIVSDLCVLVSYLKYAIDEINLSVKFCLRLVDEVIKIKPL